jgi:hypothetical protein
MNKVLFHTLIFAPDSISTAFLLTVLVKSIMIIQKYIKSQLNSLKQAYVK